MYAVEPADAIPGAEPLPPAGPRAIADGEPAPLEDVTGRCEQRLLAELERLRASAPAGADPALAAMVHAADEVAADWRERVQEVERSRRRLDEATTAAAGGRERLVALLAVIGRFAPVANEATATDATVGDTCSAETAGAPEAAEAAGAPEAAALAEGECPLLVGPAHLGPGRRGWFGARRQAVRPDPRDHDGARPGASGADPSHRRDELAPDQARVAVSCSVDLAVHLLGPFQLLPPRTPARHPQRRREASASSSTCSPTGTSRS